MNLLTITLLIVAVCNITTLWLYIQLKRKLDIEAWAWTEDRTEHRNGLQELIRILTGQASTHQLILGQIEQLSTQPTEDGQLTRQRIAQIKTRLADEECEDQRAKAKARRLRQK